jgi:hypothetical protein
MLKEAFDVEGELNENFVVHAEKKGSNLIKKSLQESTHTSERKTCKD